MAHAGAKFNAVQRDQILTEAIQREERRLLLCQDFTLPDRRTLRILPAKPNATTPAAAPTAAQLEAAEAVLTRLSGRRQPAAAAAADGDEATTAAEAAAAAAETHRRELVAKWLPPTSNSEYGFYNGGTGGSGVAGASSVAADPRFHYASSSTDVTRYAAAYVTLTGRGPFSRAVGSSSGGGGGGK